MGGKTKWVLLMLGGSILFTIFLILGNLIVAGALGGALILLFLWKIPQWQTSGIETLKDRLSVENETRKTLAQICGGAAVIASLYVAWNSFDLSREGQITDRFTQAINQLGSDKLQIRLGAIYALDRIAEDSPRDRIPITEVLAAYIRTQSPWNERPVWVNVFFETFFLPQEVPQDDPEILGVQLPRNPLSDIQAVVTILGQLSWIYKYDGRGNPYLNVSNTDLRKVNLQNLHFKEANFTGANLGEAKLQKAHLEKADFTLARLERSTFTDAHLSEANLFGARLWGATLTRADLRGAILQWAGLQGATLEGIQLRDADLRWTDFRKADKVAASSIREAKNWEHAYYSPELLQDLGLPPDHNDQLEVKREFIKEKVRKILTEGSPH